MNLKPLADRIILKCSEEENTKSVFVLKQDSKEKPQVFEVIEVGPGGTVDGKEIVMTVKKGDKVVTNKYSGTEIKLGDIEYVIVKQGDILAIVNE